MRKYGSLNTTYEGMNWSKALSPDVKLSWFIRLKKAMPQVGIAKLVKCKHHYNLLVELLAFRL